MFPALSPVEGTTVRRHLERSQRALAALIENGEGHGIPGPYPTDLEHNQRHPPRGFLLHQFATVPNLDVDLLYFLTRQVPFDIDFSKVSDEEAVAAYRAFREIMTGKKRGQRKSSF
jgi:hypothetical protein